MKVLTRARAVLPPVFLGVLVSLALLSLLASYPTKEEWLRAQAKRLTHLKMTSEMIAKANPWRDDGTSRWYGLLSEGVIPFGSDGGVFVVTHSFHANDTRMQSILSVPALLCTGRRRVSDATMAVDQQGHLYTCEGHICGALHLTSKKPVNTLQDFLETYSYGDEKNTWKPYHPD